MNNVLFALLHISMNDVLFILLHISTVMVLLLFVFLLNVKKKKQIHYIMLVNIILLLIWSLGYIFEAYFRAYFGFTNMLFVYIWNVGLCFTPLSLFLMGKVYANTKITIQKKYIILALPQVISYVVLITNSSHGLFFTYFSIDNSQIIYGPYFILHSTISYCYSFLGLYYLIRFSIKNSGFFSKQSILLAIGSSISVLTNILIITKIIEAPLYTTAISFSFAILFISIAIFRYQFLSISPIALRTIIDRISDSFLVINDEYVVIDYNKPMELSFKNITTIRIRKSILEIFKGTCLLNEENSIIDLIEISKQSGTSISAKKHIHEGQVDKYFDIEITPIISHKNYLGTIILFKDITESIRHLEAIEEKHLIMMEQERLASLGQLIGGIAHNLKTPIMSIAGAVEGLKDLVVEYEQSIGDTGVTVEDHHEIAAEMNTWLTKIKPYCSYMSDIIDTVKGQTVKFNTSLMIGFPVNEVVKRIELLLKYELIRHKCTLKTEINANSSLELYGDINSLVQVFDNIIINAIQAYEGKTGTIDLIIKEKDNSILFEVRDYAKGIPETIKDKLLKEMITTKGTSGTGLGLYMSSSTIKARFGGNMWFTSKEDGGTSFYIQIPNKMTLN